ncbi:hypothetical protein [Halomonas koreensis]|uniref:Uncharacterized protein n=1 Tax=Halomonas koreensis TaxID=245385 RepID=A0ABU1G752_9GAMM|nr:hypothetical protein [Halomonas koreensis]MDR5868710.1 hypothetical protein [Halomonas koreensis]
MHEPELARALSPIEELPEDGVRIAGSAPGRAGLTLVLPAAQQAEVSGLMRNLRQGIASTPSASLAGDGMGLLIFATQLSTLAQAWNDFWGQVGSDENVEVWPLVNSVVSTGSVGFSAAQGVMDTALSSRLNALNNALQVSGAKSVSASLGRLHMFLGGFTYAFGFVASYVSLTSRHDAWQEAVRSGDRSAQSAAMASMVGAGGMLGSNAYGLANTLHAGYSVAFRGVSWAAAGARLGSVFWRFNLAGALFTVLELGGSWLYNRYSTSRHDDWLLTTPWSQDADQVRDDDVETYQSRLQAIAQAPRIKVSIEEFDGWWKSWTQGPKSVDFALSLSSVSLQDLSAPFGGKAPVRLFLGGYQVQPEYRGRDYCPERWVTATEKVLANLTLEEQSPLSLGFPRPEPLDSISGRRTDNVIAIRLEELGDDGQYRVHNYHIRISASGGEGDYTPSSVAVSGETAPWKEIDTLLLN